MEKQILDLLQEKDSVGELVIGNQKRIKMKTVSNIMGAIGIAIVVISFILKTCGIVEIDMTDALKVGGFCKGVFLPVDASVWINNIFKRD